MRRRRDFGPVEVEPKSLDEETGRCSHCSQTYGGGRAQDGGGRAPPLRNAS